MGQTHIWVTGVGLSFSLLACGPGESAVSGPATLAEVPSTSQAKLLASQPFLPPSSPLALARQGDRIFVELPDPSPRSTAWKAKVSLPAKADGAFSLQDLASGMSLSVALEGTRRVEAEQAEGYLVYPGAYRDEGHVIHRVDTEGTEDFVLFDRPPAEPRLRYHVQLDQGVAGLRLVANVLEFLDKEGAPRLRVASPWGVNAAGRRIAARLSVEGCAVDTSPRAPWGRPVTAPGAAACEVAVAWEAREAVRAIDPAWSTTGKMKDTRSAHTATLIATPTSQELVLVAGGSPGVNPTDSAEFFDPLSKTWASASSLTRKHTGHTASLLKDGRVLVAGGEVFNPDNSVNETSPLAEIYDPLAASWVAAPPMNERREHFTATSLADGRVLVAGGGQGLTIELVEIFDPTGPGTWTYAAPMKVRRAGHTASLLASGKVLVAGGLGINNDISVTSAEIYDPLADSWLLAGEMTKARSDHTASVLPDGRVFVAGGGEGAGQQVQRSSSGEIFDPGGAGSWSLISAIGQGRSSHTGTVIAGGNVLLVGGGDEGPDADLFYPAGAGSFAPAGAMKFDRSRHTATLLSDGRVLIAGGTDSSHSAEIWEVQPPNGSCKEGGECTTGFCADGICCSTECKGLCMACTNAKTGKPDGVCAPVTAGTDPNQQCKDDGVVACKQTGLCDGMGACGLHDPGPCAAGTCMQNVDCSSGHCVDGVCCEEACNGFCMACSAKLTGKTDGLCDLALDGTDAHNNCTQLGSGVCQTTGLCNGKGACQLTATPCGEPSCFDTTTQKDPAKCDANGLCVSAVTTSSCVPYICADQGGCKTSCVTSDDCVTNAGFACVKGKCSKGADPGTACTAGSDCLSSYCEDGVCCDTMCQGECRACSAAKKGYGKDGACDDIQQGVDPDDECPTEDPTSCQRTGVCSGSGGCEKYGSNTICQTTSCKDGVLQGITCDSNGGCGPKTGMLSCGLFACNDAQTCATVCADDKGCDPKAHCENKTCVPDLLLGDACGDSARCDSGFCVDGVCCDTACTGQCESCNAKGKCLPIAAGEQPGPGRTKCNLGDAECSGACDGGDPTACKYPDGSKLCAATSCDKSILKPVVCNNHGACAVQPSQDCGLLACDSMAGACKQSCSGDRDCATGAVCNKATSQCTAGGTVCHGDFSTQSANGNIFYCEGYRCIGDACQQQCGTVSDCDHGFSCQAGRCVKDTGSGGAAPSAEAPAPDSGGCGCTTAGSPASPRAALALALALGLGLRRRRRSARRAATGGALRP